MRTATVDMVSLAPPLGRLQQRLLHALRHHGGGASLQCPAALAAGLIPTLDTRPPYDRVPPRATYVATARAVAALRRRGLVDTALAGTTKGHLHWPQNGRPFWQFRNPSTRLMVRAVVDSLVAES